MTIQIRTPVESAEIDADAFLPTESGNFRIRVTVDENGLEHCLVYTGNLTGEKTPLIRIHSECLTGDAFGSLKCDCGSQLKSAIKIMSSKGGIILYMPEEGRNIGFLNKIRTYDYQFHGLDTIDANHALGFDSDQRDYISASTMLKSLGVKTINLLSNNPNKKLNLEKEGIKVNKTIQLKVIVADEAKGYMKTKKIKSGHIL